jgi:hypothetical protein
MEDMASDQVSKTTAHHHIGPEVLQARESRNRDGGGGAICEPLNRRLGIFVCDCGGGPHVIIACAEGNELSKPLL